MIPLSAEATGREILLMGNEALARGALEAGIEVCAAYPGNPSSEITQSLAGIAEEAGLHVEWSINEKVALETAASAALVGLRGLAAMKQNGLNVASDFLLNLNLTGIRGGLVVAVCDDPGGISSSNEQDSRLFARMGDLPLLEPADFQEAKDMMVRAFDLSEELALPVLVHSVTRISHARGNVVLGAIAKRDRRAFFDKSRPFLSLPPTSHHALLRKKLARAGERMSRWPFNRYEGPDRPDLLIVTVGGADFYSREAISVLDLAHRVGRVKVGASWPLPEKFLIEHLARADRILFVEEGGPFLEGGVKELCAQAGPRIGVKKFLGRASGDIPEVGELDPDLVISTTARLLGIEYRPRSEEYAARARRAAADHAPARTWGFCAGCPHRASYWAIKNALAMDDRDGFVLGDIGCYSMGVGPSGFHQMKTIQAMGSGAGLASGMGQFQAFGLNQPVLAVCGDSTFFHAVLPALVNARHQKADCLLIVLDNRATAMTGFQPHPGLDRTATGAPGPEVDIEALCRGIGVTAQVRDPYDLEETRRTLSRMIEDEKGLRVLILRRECALVRAKRHRAEFRMRVDGASCLGEACGCQRLCTRVFKCPGLIWDPAAKQARIDEAICAGCGVCAQICPTGAIIAEVT